MNNSCLYQLTASQPGSSWALYGLAGNPPHAGHWACVQQLLDQGRRVLVAPSYAHAFGKKMAPFETRVKWLHEASRDFGHDCEHVVIWPGEADLAADKPAGAPIYSIEMLQRARAQCGGDVALAIGPDNADPAIFSRFYQHDTITREHGLIVLKETAGVRSTLIRQRLQSGVFGLDEVSSWVGPTIALSVMRHFAKSGPGFKVL